MRAGERNMVKAKTYYQVLSASADLFNEFGVESVSIYKVAEHLGISTGNLTYHFKRKKDLIEAHIDVFDSQLIEQIESFPRDASGEEYLAAYMAMLRLSWDYRFLFNSAQYILQSDLVDLSRYERLIAHIAETFENHVEELIRRGHMKPVRAPYSVVMLVDCVWWQWLGWLRVNQLKRPEDQVTFDEINRNVVEHLHFLVEPYLKPRLNRQIYALIEAAFGKRKS